MFATSDTLTDIQAAIHAKTTSGTPVPKDLTLLVNHANPHLRESLNISQKAIQRTINSADTVVKRSLEALSRDVGDLKKHYSTIGSAAFEGDLDLAPLYTHLALQDSVKADLAALASMYDTYPLAVKNAIKQLLVDILGVQTERSAAEFKLPSAGDVVESTAVMALLDTLLKSGYLQGFCGAYGKKEEYDILSLLFKVANPS